MAKNSTPEGQTMAPEIVPEPELQGMAGMERVQEYAEILLEIEGLREETRFWKNTLAHPAVEAWIDKIQSEIDEQKLSWENIAPKNFAQSQAEVKAQVWMLSRLQHPDAQERLDSAQHKESNVRITYPILLAAAGYDIAGRRTDSQADQGAKVMDDLFGGNAENADDEDPGESEHEEELDNQNDGKGRTYLYNTPNFGKQPIFVSKGIGDTWMVCYRKENGSLKRVNSNHLPVCDYRDEAQGYLDTFAKSRNLEEAADPEGIAPAVDYAIKAEDAEDIQRELEEAHRAEAERLAKVKQKVSAGAKRRDERGERGERVAA